MATSIITKSIMLLSGFIMMGTAFAKELPPPAYQLAAKMGGVPADMLYSIALAESGMKIGTKIRPWPWTLNVAGEARRFKTQQAACQNLKLTLRTVSAKRIDVGLAQVNYGYHRHRVSDPCDLLDPYRNLSIAASILREHYLKDSTSGWLIAAGRYHHPAGGTHAARYRASVQKQLIRIGYNSQYASFPKASQI
ncbi:transglycosylase SLT domain-containing protein [Zophobihabitans entericus]|uniref:Lytic transglycosylase domain-containing protein n=1 Tax=Zophobihabitans entericus TaxID=1635327 RepID=A0A6G9ID48_9GAMM|nr:transglycosylase SLT domain-containing protein [Zophobihabitans entericus]QIQ22161.1 lytic transglycosylase domain-containing protein [Zophobihabitans entericus]